MGQILSLCLKSSSNGETDPLLSSQQGNSYPYTDVDQAYPVTTVSQNTANQVEQLLKIVQFTNQNLIDIEQITNSNNGGVNNNLSTASLPGADEVARIKQILNGSLVGDAEVWNIEKGEPMNDQCKKQLDELSKKAYTMLNVSKDEEPLKLMLTFT